MRKDLPLEQQLVQSCHACIEAASLIPNGSEHPHLVVCSVENESQLFREAERLRELGIQYRIFYEADIGDQATALATEPVYGDNRKNFKRYKLLKFSGQGVPAPLLRSIGK